MAVTMGLVDLAVQAVDGTKITANAANDRTYDAEGLQRVLERVEAAISDLEAQNEAGEGAVPTRLPKELAKKEALREQVQQAMQQPRWCIGEEQQRINLADSDAGLMKACGGFVTRYNAQAVVSPLQPATSEGTGLVITAADVVRGANDCGQLTPMLQQAEEVTGGKAQVTLADAGYHSGANLEACAQREQEVIMPENQHKALEHPYHKDRFRYDKQTDSYTCPQDQDTALHPTQADQRDAYAALQGLWSHLPSVSGLRHLHQGRASWAWAGSRTSRSCPASSSGMDVY